VTLIGLFALPTAAAESPRSGRYTATLLRNGFQGILAQPARNQEREDAVRDQALEWIDKAFERSERDVVFLKSIPEFRGLRNDPGFGARVARLKLPDHIDSL
jgi:hypothetical protein